MRTGVIGVVVVGLAGCGGDDGPTTYDCAQLARDVEQRHGTCVVELAETDLDACPLYKWAYCGNEADCPSGWAVSCDAGDFGQRVNCHYGSTMCSVNEGSAGFAYVQTLDGVDGIATYVRTDITRCEFRPCR